MVHEEKVNKIRSKIDMSWIGYLLCEAYLLSCRELEKGDIDFRTGDTIRSNLHSSIERLGLPKLPISYLETFKLSNREIEKIAKKYMNELNEREE